MRAVEATRSVEARAPAAGSSRRTDSTQPATARTVGTTVMTTRTTKIRRLKGRAIFGANLGSRFGCDNSTRGIDEGAHPLSLVQHEAASGDHRYHRRGFKTGRGERGPGRIGPRERDAHLGFSLRERSRVRAVGRHPDVARRDDRAV